MRQPTRTDTQSTQQTPRMVTNIDEENSDNEDVDLIRLNSKQKNIHVNLKSAMKTLQDFKLDS